MSTALFLFTFCLYLVCYRYNFRALTENLRTENFQFLPMCEIPEINFYTYLYLYIHVYFYIYISYNYIDEIVKFNPLKNIQSILNIFFEKLNHNYSLLNHYINL